MTRTEEAIIKGFLMGAHKAVEDARTQSPENLLVHKVPMILSADLLSSLK